MLTSVSNSAASSNEVKFNTTLFGPLALPLCSGGPQLSLIGPAGMWSADVSTAAAGPKDSLRASPNATIAPKCSGATSPVWLGGMFMIMLMPRPTVRRYLA